MKFIGIHSVCMSSIPIITIYTHRKQSWNWRICRYMYIWNMQPISRLSRKIRTNTYQLEYYYSLCSFQHLIPFYIYSFSDLFLASCSPIKRVSRCLSSQLQNNLTWMSLSDKFDIFFVFHLDIHVFTSLCRLFPGTVLCIVFFRFHPRRPFIIFWFKCQYIPPKHIYMHVS